MEMGWVIVSSGDGVGWEGYLRSGGWGGVIVRSEGCGEGYCVLYRTKYSATMDHYDQEQK